MGQEHLPGALPGEAASEALPGDNATPRVGLPGVKATLRLALPGVKATLTLTLPGVKATLRVGLPEVKATPHVGLPGDKATPGHQGPRGLEGSRKTHAAALGTKLQALIAAILPLSTPLPVLQVAKVETKRQATIETPLTIIAPYPLPSHKRVPQ